MSTTTTTSATVTPAQRTHAANTLMGMYVKANEKKKAVKEELNSIVEMLKQFSPQLIEGCYNDDSSIDLSFKVDRDEFYENTYETLHDVISGAVEAVNSGNGEPSIHVNFGLKASMASSATLMYANKTYEVELFDEGSVVSFLREEHTKLSSALELILEHM